ncbi:MAG: ATP-binding cassette domain-containing protein, partial [Ruminococcus sp.]|nr:ATP-binding cassette domain-containing protein [Ruminococcus sp.]
STLIKMIAGELQADSGNIIIGDTVKVGYFSQECENMDSSQRVIEYIRETADNIQTSEGTVTASKMLERFLFTSELQWNRIEKLSGGERKRLYLLKVLMTAPNVLLLDEPTNDLDIATLTILEDYLENFNGAVVAISHDRYFLDKMSTEIWELTGNGEVRRYNGNYSDYAEKALNNNDTEEKEKVRKEKKKRTFTGVRKLKFSFKEQREYETIDDDIAELEKQIKDTESEILKSSSDYVKLQELSETKEKLENQLSDKMERWVYLNDLAERIANGETVQE